MEDTLAANLSFESGVLATCLWSYVGNKNNPIDQIEIFGTEGMISFSISGLEPIIIKKKEKEETYRFEKPKHVELPMIEEVVDSLLGLNSFKSNMHSAARTSLIMDKIMGQI